VTKVFGHALGCLFRVAEGLERVVMVGRSHPPHFDVASALEDAHRRIGVRRIPSRHANLSRGHAGLLLDGAADLLHDEGRHERRRLGGEALECLRALREQPPVTLPVRQSLLACLLQVRMSASGSSCVSLDSERSSALWMACPLVSSVTSLCNTRVRASAGSRRTSRRPRSRRCPMRSTIDAKQLSADSGGRGPRGHRPSTRTPSPLLVLLRPAAAPAATFHARVAGLLAARVPARRRR
jgi:hypothetical protein